MQQSTKHYQTHHYIAPNKLADINTLFIQEVLKKKSVSNLHSHMWLKQTNHIYFYF